MLLNPKDMQFLIAWIRKFKLMTLSVVSVWNVFVFFFEQTLLGHMHKRVKPRLKLELVY